MRPNSASSSRIACSCAASFGASSRSASCSPGEVSEAARLWNTEAIRRYDRPLASSAATVFAKVGGAGFAAIAAISPRWSRIAASSAGAKCAGAMRPNGGRPYGAVQGSSSGLAASDI